jgi:hypothetical protein
VVHFQSFFIKTFFFTYLVHWFKIDFEVIFMATNRQRYTVSVDNEMFQEIENFRFERRFQTRSQATVELIRLGLNALKKERNASEADGEQNHRDE